MKSGKRFWLLLAASAFVLFAQAARANNLAVVHVGLTGEAPGSHVLVKFDVSWENSWRNDLTGVGQGAPFNYDAVWAFVKFSTDGGASWSHATLSTVSGDHSVSNDNGVAAVIQAAPDGKGIFIHRANNGNGANDWQGVRLRWNYASDGVAQITSATIVNVVALEMVYIPPGSFFAQAITPPAARRFNKARLTPIPGKSPVKTPLR
jgi:hypothetical protein